MNGLVVDHSPDALAVECAETRVIATCAADKDGFYALPELWHRANWITCDSEILEDRESRETRHLGECTDEVRAQVEGAEA